MKCDGNQDSPRIHTCLTSSSSYPTPPILVHPSSGRYTQSSSNPARFNSIRQRRHRWQSRATQEGLRAPRGRSVQTAASVQLIPADLHSPNRTVVRWPTHNTRGYCVLDLRPVVSRLSGHSWLTVDDGNTDRSDLSHVCQLHERDQRPLNDATQTCRSDCRSDCVPHVSPSIVDLLGSCSSSASTATSRVLSIKYVLRNDWQMIDTCIPHRATRVCMFPIDRKWGPIQPVTRCRCRRYQPRLQTFRTLSIGRRQLRQRNTKRRRADNRRWSAAAAVSTLPL